ncbi:hypothetical protein FHR71_001753 [Methylobacterium sp. RAS18]|nr:hypothetical protein [Methylobacterium sp. RAS18]
MDGNMFRDLGKGLGLYAGAAFGLVVVAALFAGGFGWWSLLGWPGSVVLGFIGGAALDQM